MKLRMGVTLQSGKYQLTQVLGRESLGATYLATQTLLQQSVVIKTIDPSLQITQSFPQIKTQFVEEIRLLARCQHPSLVRVLDFFQEDGLPFLVMEYIPGQTLYDRISTPNAPKLTEAEAIHYLRQAASALSVAHRNGLIHRNIRPESIVRRQGTNLGVLVGFGFAHEIVPAISIEKNLFLPPDLDWSQDNRFAIDLYSLAATLYFLLTGQAPDRSVSLDSYPWSPATKQAIFRGLTRDAQWKLQTVDDWLRLLPNTTLPLMAANHIAQTAPNPSQTGRTRSPESAQNGRTRSPEPAPIKSFPIQNGRTPAKTPVAQPALIPTTAAISPTPSPSATVTPAPISIAPASRLPKFLMLTIAAAGAIGLGFGLALRISATKAPGTSLLQPVQSFPEKEWKGTLSSDDKDAANIPVESGSVATDKTQQRIADPPIDRSIDVPPKIVTPSPEPIRPRRRPISEPLDPVQPTPTVEPTAPAPAEIATPDPVVPPVTDPVPAPVAPVPVKPTTRDIAPTPTITPP